MKKERKKVLNLERGSFVKFRAVWRSLLVDQYITVYYTAVLQPFGSGPYPDQNPKGGGGRSTFFINIFMTIFYNFF